MDYQILAHTVILKKITFLMFLVFDGALRSNFDIEYIFTLYNIINLYEKLIDMILYFYRI